MNISNKYKKNIKKKILLLSFLLLVMVIAALTGISNGIESFDFKKSFIAFFSDAGLQHKIIWELRVPRIVMAILTGSGLAVAGTVFQAILKNPLASPYTLGTASGAGFGAVIAIFLLDADFLYKDYFVAGSAFFFTMLSSLIILSIAKIKIFTNETMILAGIAIMFLFSSLSSLFQYLGTMEQVNEIVFWFFGSLSKVGWNEIGIASVMILLPMPLLFKWSWSFNLIAADDESAKALGIDVEKVKIFGIVCASLITAGAICFTGVIGFIGIVSPHIVRMLIGYNHRFLLPGAALVGASLVLTADTVGRIILPPQVIPIGIVTSFIGVPFFFYLLMKRTKDYWR
ncbi:iron ABC transporter permease [Desulfobacula sp.]|uniref:FecCD family ABC transporter permease n=1 Tax=Desulfobacula sp. TaxID=2593537 RepID=UPI0025C6A847|nr:iron ABC transporter permease [Desulfobacula sp.]